MEFMSAISLKQRKKGDLLVLPFWNEKKEAKPAASIESFLKEIKAPLETKDFKGKEGEVLFLYSHEGIEPRLVLLGLGEKNTITRERLRRAGSSLVKECLCRKLETINLVLPVIDTLGSQDVIRGIAEGMALTNYQFDKLKKESIKGKEVKLVKQCTWIGASQKDLAQAKKAAVLAKGVAFARDLVNGNADDVTPQMLAETAKSLAHQFKTLKVTVFDKKRIEKEKMDLLLAVNRGSATDPTFILLEYKGNPSSKDHTVLVGKGVTYDTGGLNLKPTGFMETMKCDMSGAAAVLGTLLTAASLSLKQNITGVIPCTENSIGSKSYKPGDVYSSYAGLTVEIANTDAEGRLVLADALAYAVKNLKPTRMIDLATLTGAVVICLGEEAIGLMASDDQLAEKLAKAGEATYERVWRLPLFEEYKKQLESDVADLKNSGGRAAGSITGALFLQEFVDHASRANSLKEASSKSKSLKSTPLKSIPWAHLDIAGTAFRSKGSYYQPKNASGVGVRLLIEFLENL